VDRTIRAGTNADRALCVDLWLTVLETRDGQTQTPAVASRALAKFDKLAVRFAVVGKSPIGFCLMVDDAIRRVAVLELLAVSPTASGRGLGRALLADAIRTAEEIGYPTIELQVRSGNQRAERLYVAAGFERSGDPVPHPLGGAAILTYERKLTTRSRPT
jgi:ribosomal protein S18 acetylase RimI-like enzyme